MSDTVFACDLTVFPPEQRARHLIEAPLFFATLQSVCELPDGYAFRLPDAPDVLLKAADFINHERLCCPFFHFGIEVEPNSGPMWLRLSGEEGVKALIVAELSLYLAPDVRSAAGWH